MRNRITRYNTKPSFECANDAPPTEEGAVRIAQPTLHIDGAIDLNHPQGDDPSCHQCNRCRSKRVRFEGLCGDRLDGPAEIRQLSDRELHVRIREHRACHRASKRSCGVAGFLNLLGGIKHRVLNAWAVDDIVVSEASVTYTRKDGSTLTTTAAAIWKLKGRLIDECRIYADASALFGH